MKKLKYRVWHNKYLDGKWKLSPVCSIRWNNSDSITVNATNNPENWIPVVIPTDKECVLEQFTGLLDCEGKEIYEGDVLVIPNQYPYYDYADEKHPSLNDTGGRIVSKSVLNYVGIVEWNAGGFDVVLKCVNPQKRGISEGIGHCIGEDTGGDSSETLYKIVGNIHEVQP